MSGAGGVSRTEDRSRNPSRRSSRRGDRCPRELLALLVLTALAWPTTTQAREAQLRPLPLQTLPALGPWLDRGDLVLLESNPDGSLSQVSVIARVRAPAGTVLDVLAHPEDFPTMVPSMVRSEVRSRNGRQREVAWEIEIPFKNPAGVNRYIDDRPRAIRYWPLEGSIPSGSWEWRAFPQDAGSCILVHTTYADTREISWIVRRFLAAWPTFEHGAVAATAIVFFKAVAGRAEEIRSGTKHPPPSYTPGRVGSIRPITEGEGRLDPTPLAPLLQQGMVALIEYTERHQLRQISILQRMAAGPGQVYGLVANPAGYPTFIPSVSSVQVLIDFPDRCEYRQWMEMPLIKLQMQLRMRRDGSRVVQRAEGGDLPSSMSGWDMLPDGQAGSSLAIYYNYLDPGEISWFVKKLLVKEPVFHIGLNLALSTVLVRAIADRAKTLAGGGPATAPTGRAAAPQLSEIPR
ncbi:MAG: hypothetical protein FJ125_15575 [Deltaproteobacteria bacterium]|nr:hypothetical protein [Deltaproteobacteria bacterium]